MMLAIYLFRCNNETTAPSNMDAILKTLLQITVIYTYHYVQFVAILGNIIKSKRFSFRQSIKQISN